MLFRYRAGPAITGCAQSGVYCSNKPAAVAPKETIVHHFFVSGIGQNGNCRWCQNLGGAENVVKKTETQQTFVNGLLGFITLGIYTGEGACVLSSIA